MTNSTPETMLIRQLVQVHRLEVGRIRHHLRRSRAIRPSPAVLGRTDTCALGRWLAGPDAAKLPLAIGEALHQLHAALHQEATHLAGLALVDQPPPQAWEDCCALFHQIARKLEQLLQGLAADAFQDSPQHAARSIHILPTWIPQVCPQPGSARLGVSNQLVPE